MRCLASFNQTPQIVNPFYAFFFFSSVLVRHFPEQ